MGISDVVAKSGWRSGDPLTALARVVERHRSTAVVGPGHGLPRPVGARSALPHLVRHPNLR